MQDSQSLKLQRLRDILPQIYGEVSDEAFEGILPYLTWRTLPGNEHLFHQGDEGDSLSILIAGRLQVFLNRADGTRHFVGEVARGETVGEMSMFTGEQRTADVIAVRDSVLVEISREAFEQMVALYPRMVMNLTRLVIARLKESNIVSRPRRSVVNVAILPISPGVDAGAFGEALVQQVRRHGKALVVTPGLVGESLGHADLAHCASDDEASSHRLLDWLSEQELSHDFVLYLADREATEWTRRCLRQADEVLLVGNSEDSPVPGEAERSLLAGSGKTTAAGETLVLLHRVERVDGYQGTDQWLAEREVRSCHHLRLTAERDLQRLARFLTGNAIGLVLAGGGAKGLAHVGIYRALVQRGIPVDMVGGTSIGSIIAGFIAMGWDAYRIHKDCRALFMSNPTPIWDYNALPKVSLLKGKKLDQMLAKVFKDHAISDLMLNFFCVSSSLTHTCARIHSRGQLRQAIRASISLPGILPPVVEGGDVLIDGGIFNNLPIDVMRDMGAGRVIAVDFDLEPGQEHEFDHLSPSAHGAAGRAHDRGPVEVPSMMSTIMQSVTMNSDFRSRRARAQADLLFNPDLKQFSLMEWKSYDRIVEAGYGHAMQVLEGWDEPW